jgi:hypothetical protein
VFDHQAFLVCLKITSIPRNRTRTKDQQGRPGANRFVLTKSDVERPYQPELYKAFRINPNLFAAWNSLGGRSGAGTEACADCGAFTAAEQGSKSATDGGSYTRGLRGSLA